MIVYDAAKLQALQDQARRQRAVCDGIKSEMDDARVDVQHSRRLWANENAAAAGTRYKPDPAVKIGLDAAEARLAQLDSEYAEAGRQLQVMSGIVANCRKYLADREVPLIPGPPTHGGATLDGTGAAVARRSPAPVPVPAANDGGGVTKVAARSGRYAPGALPNAIPSSAPGGRSPRMGD